MLVRPRADGKPQRWRPSSNPVGPLSFEQVQLHRSGQIPIEIHASGEESFLIPVDFVLAFRFVCSDSVLNPSHEAGRKNGERVVPREPTRHAPSRIARDGSIPASRPTRASTSHSALRAPKREMVWAAEET